MSRTLPRAMSGRDFRLDSYRSMVRPFSLLPPASDDHGLELAPGVARGHLVERDGLELRAHAGAAELLVALLADLLGGGARGLQEVARVEGAPVRGEELA